MDKHIIDEIDGVYENSGDFTSKRGLKKKFKALEKLEEKYPDNDFLQGYLEEVHELIYQAKIENKP